MASEEVEARLREAFDRLSPAPPPWADGTQPPRTWWPRWFGSFPVGWPPGTDHRMVRYGMAGSIAGIVDAARLAGPWAAITTDLVTGEETVEIIADELREIGSEGFNFMPGVEDRRRAGDSVLAGAGRLEAWVRTGVPPPDPELVRMSCRRDVYWHRSEWRAVAHRHPGYAAWLEEDGGIDLYRDWLEHRTTVPGVPSPIELLGRESTRGGPRVLSGRDRLRRFVHERVLRRGRFCGTCGASTPMERRFCRRCGSPLGRGAPG